MLNLLSKVLFIGIPSIAIGIIHSDDSKVSKIYKNN